MARHSLYSRLPLTRATSGLFWNPDRIKVVYEKDRVTFKYKDARHECYRLPIEQVSTKADKDLISKKFKADRIISWVGCAKCSKTINLTEMEIYNRARAILSKATGVQENQLNEAFLSALPYRVSGALHSQAKYDLIGEELSTAFRHRGLWFYDFPVSGIIVEVVRCWTGVYQPGGGYDSYYGDYDPPYLGKAVHHQLYGCQTWSGERALVHPSDIEEVS